MFPNPYAIIPARIDRITPFTTTTAEASKMNPNPNFLNSVLSAVTFAVIGIVIFVVFFVILDWITPYNLWKELNEEKNEALAMVVGAVALGICIIIAAAIH
jgi:putative membrane protein